MKKSISFDEFQSVKRVAQACNPLKVKRDKVQAKIEALQAEYNAYDTQISALEAGIKSIIGFRTEELVKKIIVPGTDKNGKEIKTTKYVPTDIVTYDKDKKQYVITVPDAPEANEDTNASDTEEEVSENAQQPSNE